MHAGASFTTPTVTGLTFSHNAICRDLLRLSQIGEADNARGRIVRAFFWLLDRVMPVSSS